MYPSQNNLSCSGARITTGSLLSCVGHAHGVNDPGSVGIMGNSSCRSVVGGAGRAASGGFRTTVSHAKFLSEFESKMNLRSFHLVEVSALDPAAYKVQDLEYQIGRRHV